MRKRLPLVHISKFCLYHNLNKTKKYVIIYSVKEAMATFAKIFLIMQFNLAIIQVSWFTIELGSADVGLTL